MALITLAGIATALGLVMLVAQAVEAIAVAVIAVKIAYEYVRWEPGSNTTLPDFPKNIPERNLDIKKINFLFPENYEFPHHVSILLRKEHYCSGSLISKKHVLTAGQCVIPYFSRKAQLASYRVAVAEDESGTGLSFVVDAMNISPPYSRDMKVLQDKISVIRIRGEVKLSKYANVIALPMQVQSHSHVGQILNGTGFSLMLESSRNFIKFDVSITSNEDCQKYFPDRSLSGKFCAFTTSDYGACQGEGGSPVTIDNEYVIGVFLEPSDYGCGHEIPDLYSFVPHYLEFIETQMKRQ